MANVQGMVRIYHIATAQVNMFLGICAGYQYHINADIALAHWHYFLHTNDVEWLKEKGWPIISNAAELFTSFVDVSLTWSKGKHWTWSVTDPVRDPWIDNL